jgi:protein-disulfide isomerase
MKRRKILIDFGRLGIAAGTSAVLGGIGGGGVATSFAWAQDGGLPERALGPPDSEITIIEYASLTCPHCAHFHETTYPELKAQWIDSGKARFVYRHFPLDGLALRAAALAECMEGQRFFGFLNLLFTNQQSWARSSDPIKALQNLAKQAGMDEATSEACLTDDVVISQVLAQIDYGEFDKFLSGLL